MVSRRTDLAIELQEGLKQPLCGVRREEKRLENGISYMRVKIEEEQASKELGKPCGTYLSLQWEDMAGKSRAQLHEFSMKAAKMIRELQGIKQAKRILVAGLGNRKITPDSYGPRVCDRLFVTRHLLHSTPDFLQEGYREVCAIAPGVMGVTGMETCEIIKGVADLVEPDLIVAVDALASEKTERIGAILQVSDTGIQPGSGLGNARRALDAAYLGTNVVSMGIPMVTYASVIADGLVREAFRGKANEQDIRQFMEAINSAQGAELIVTTRHIDVLADKAAEATAMALNMALHPGFDAELAALLAD